MATEVYNKIAKCQGCVQNESWYRRKWPSKFISASGPLNFIAMDKIASFLKPEQGN